MILFLLVALCLISVPITGGQLGRLAEIRLRCLWTAPLALALQVVITTIAPGGNAPLHASIHIATYALAGVFLWTNRHLAGIAAITAGTLANALAILANAGVMPASAAAQRIAGLVDGRGFHNSAPLAHPHLLWLGDIIPIPGPWPLHNVLSIGDCVIFAGLLLLLRRTCRPDTRPSADGLKKAPVTA